MQGHPCLFARNRIIVILVIIGGNGRFTSLESPIAIHFGPDDRTKNRTNETHVRARSLQCQQSEDAHTRGGRCRRKRREEGETITKESEKHSLNY